MKKLTLLIFTIFFLISCNNSLIDRLNPNILAKVDSYKITMDSIKARINEDNEQYKLTQPIILYYINEMIKEIIIDEEFKRLKFKITKQDKKNVPFLEKLNHKEIQRYIKFKKVKNYVVRKITPPSRNECLRFYREHISRYNHNEKVKLNYLIFADEKQADKIFKESLSLSLDKVLKKYKLKYNFKGVIAIKNIPDEIKKGINYKKKHSLWFVKSEAGYFYIINVIDYYNKPIPFEEVKDDITAEILQNKRKKYFDLWLKNEIKKRHITIYYNKIG